MVVVENAHADEILRALANATRRDIVVRTLTREQSVSSLAASYPMSFAAVQKHVAVLERAGVVRKRPRGREQLVRSRPEAIRTARELLEGYEELWRRRLDRFDHVLTETTNGEGENP